MNSDLLFLASLIVASLLGVPPCCVGKPRQNLGYAYVFRLASRKNSGVIFSQILSCQTIIPRFYLRKRYLWYFASLLLAILGIVILHSYLDFAYFWNRRLPVPEDWPFSERLWERGRFPLIAPIFFKTAVFLSCTLASTLYESTRLANQQERRTQLLEKEKLATEVQFLKSQINPHFLFNALNNVYTLSLIRSERTPEVVMKLSEMLRYMLYESGQARVPLQKEVRYIRHYIALQQMKQPRPLAVETDLPDVGEQLMVAPLLFAPIVENGFKHGKIGADEHSWIRIDLAVQNGELDFHVSNTIPPKFSDRSSKGGIGLKNIQRRLELLYPHRHHLSIVDGEALFSVNLKIILS